MQTVNDILGHKQNSEIYSVKPDTTVFEAIKLMSDKEIGCLLVLEGEKLVGIVTERDYARKVALLDKTSRNLPVKDIMTTRVLCVARERTVKECMALMSDKRVRHLPVLDHKKVVGLVSVGDLVNAIIYDQQVLIDQLQHYISG